MKSETEKLSGFRLRSIINMMINCDALDDKRLKVVLESGDALKWRGMGEHTYNVLCWAVGAKPIRKPKTAAQQRDELRAKIQRHKEIVTELDSKLQKLL